MMLSGSDLKPGKKIIYEGIPHEITAYEHLKVAMGKGLEKVSMRNLVTGNMLSNMTFREVDKFEEADVSSANYEYLYSDGSEYFFMNKDTYDQVSLTDKVVGDAKLFLTEGDKVVLQEYNGLPINITLEPSVTLEVIDTPPGEKGNTATGGKKPATLSTGLVVQVPLFMAIGDKVKVDTREKSYLGRA
ncbi:MAG: elongation factor P [Candidatus Gracilibacteria bacterium]|nr:elongation factor P [Candidatus Gracilibacteria bacterium]